MLTKIDGIRVGHAADAGGLTGCTVVVYDVPTVCGVDVRGANPGTSNTDLLRPTSVMPEIHGIVLPGGSAVGLNSITGMLRYLMEQKRGFDVGIAKIPIVPAAVIYDLSIGQPVYPDAEMGYQACLNASGEEFERGSVGVGIGATIGKLYGLNYATKGGIGTSCLEMHDGILVGALVIVNAFGDIIDPSTRQILAGTHGPDGVFVGTLEKMKQGQKSGSAFQFTNTTNAVVATNARLTKEEANRVATIAHDGIAQVISPSHTNVDGDTIFATGFLQSSLRGPIDIIGNVAAEAVALAVIDAVKSAKSLGGVPSSSELAAIRGK